MHTVNLLFLDINIIQNYNNSEAKRKNLAHIMYRERQNSLDGIGELMKNLWLIMDNPKINFKEKERSQ